MKIKYFEQINKEDMEYRRPCQIGQFLKDLVEDEGSFNWKTACLYWGIFSATLVIVVAVVWGIVLLVR